jgi:hypothetical protein
LNPVENSHGHDYPFVRHHGGDGVEKVFNGILLIVRFASVSNAVEWTADVIARKLREHVANLSECRSRRSFGHLEVVHASRK